MKAGKEEGSWERTLFSEPPVSVKANMFASMFSIFKRGGYAKEDCVRSGLGISASVFSLCLLFSLDCFKVNPLQGFAGNPVP